LLIRFFSGGADPATESGTSLGPMSMTNRPFGSRGTTKTFSVLSSKTSVTSTRALSRRK
jgi:hypothetical protein